MPFAHLNPATMNASDANSGVTRPDGSPISMIALRMLRLTSALASIAVFADVVWGGIVRINGAGMTCPDWPRCRGAWFPTLDNQVALEWTHRFAAPVLSLLIIATFIAAWRARREAPRAWRAAWWSGGLLAAQVVVGGITIRYANNPPSVAAHLALGILTFVSLLIVWYAAGPRRESRGFDGAAALALSRLALSSAIMTLFAIIAAGYMSASNAGGACVGLPVCDGWTPAQTPAQQIHVAHRLLAYVAFASIVALGWAVTRSATAPRDAVRLAWAALVLGSLQIVLGAATVLSGLAPVLRSMHQANGALVLATLALTAFALYSALPAPAGAPRSTSAIPQTS